VENIVLKISIMLVPGLFAITLHEVAHGYLAEKFGDPTARLLGRLTLNPLKHLDPIGTLALLLFGFGWAKPVPVNFGNLRHPQRDMIWVSLGGPLMNLTLALASALLLRLLIHFGGFLPQQGSLGGMVLEPLALMIGFSLYINVLLGLFNLVPLPPFDGGRVVIGLLPARASKVMASLEPFGFIIVLLLIFYTDLWRLVFQPLINQVVIFLAGPSLVIVQTAMDFLLSRS